MQRSILDLKNARMGRAESTAKEKYVQHKSDSYAQKLIKLMLEQKQGRILIDQENKLKQVFGKKLTRVFLHNQMSSPKPESPSPFKLIRTQSV